MAELPESVPAYSSNTQPEVESVVEKQPDPLPSAGEAARLEILLEDGPLLAVNKSAGMLSQGAPRGQFCLPDYVKAYLKEKYAKPGNVYLGVVHRLDRPVTGVVVFSRNSKGAARLAEQFRERQVQKTYLALLEQAPPAESGVLVDYLRKIPEQARAVVEPHETSEAKRAELAYRVLGSQGPYCLVEVHPHTGRMHQIRIQFASRGCPIVGDQLYGANKTLDLQPLRSDYTERIALHAWSLQLKHPVRYDDLEITAPLPADWPPMARNLLEQATFSD